ncbi:MAG: hypothetical protein FRX49_06643 [Trebouxia sp. A1-2]|nr:MAG: hypothetical protein FRX49_06643 [Trebouxia sp. A1-2]
MALCWDLGHGQVTQQTEGQTLRLLSLDLKSQHQQQSTQHGQRRVIILIITAGFLSSLWSHTHHLKAALDTLVQPYVMPQGASRLQVQEDFIRVVVTLSARCSRFAATDTRKRCAMGNLAVWLRFTAPKTASMHMHIALSQQGGAGQPRERKGSSCAASTEHPDFHKGKRSITKMLTCPKPKTAAPWASGMAPQRPLPLPLQTMQTDLSGCKGRGFCGAGLPACAVLQRRFCASLVPPPQSSGQGLCAPSWPGLGRSSASLEDAVQLACKSRRTSSE